MICENQALEIKPLMILKSDNEKFLIIKQKEQEKYYLFNLRTGDIETKITSKSILEHIVTGKYKQLGQVYKVLYEYET